MRILILAHFYPPEMGGAAARLSGMAKWLQQMGNDVTVITGVPNYPIGKIYPGYKNVLFQKQKMDGVDLIRTRSFLSVKKSSYLRLFNYLNFMIMSILAALINKTRYEIVIASSPPLFVGVSGWFIAKVLAIPWVFDVRDLWPDIAIETGEYDSKSWLVRLGRLLADFIHLNADHITPVTESKKNKLVTQGISTDKITVVSNGIDIDFINLRQYKTPLDEENETGKCIIIYAGLIGIAQKLDVIIETAIQLKAKSDIHFFIVGDGYRKDALIKKTQECNLTNITFLPATSRKNIPSYLKQAHVALVPLASEDITDAVPSKLMEAWGCGLPVILLAEGEAKNMVEQADGGIVIPPGAVDQLKDAIVKLSLDKENLKRMGRNGYNHIIEKYSRELLTKQMFSLLLKLVIK